MTKAWVVIYRDRWGRRSEYAILASGLNQCRQWVSKLNYCTFVGAYKAE